MSLLLPGIESWPPILYPVISLTELNRPTVTLKTGVSLTGHRRFERIRSQLFVGYSNHTKMFFVIVIIFTSRHWKCYRSYFRFLLFQQPDLFLKLTGSEKSDQRSRVCSQYVSFSLKNTVTWQMFSNICIIK